jgi:hypothetical protein
MLASSKKRALPSFRYVFDLVFIAPFYNEISSLEFRGERVEVCRLEQPRMLCFAIRTLTLV